MNTPESFWMCVHIDNKILKKIVEVADIWFVMNLDKKKKKNREGVDAEKLLEIPESVRKEPCDHEDEICRLVQENEGLRAKVEYS